MAEYPYYLTSKDLFYPSVVSTIGKKRGNPLQPIYEAFTNSLEALENKSAGEIKICIHLKKDLLPDDSDLANFDKIIIHDNGVGFNDMQFKRLKMLRDSRKGPANRGTGRIQFLHFFDKTNITSIYKDDSSSTGFKKRIITLSKSKEFLDNNSIIRIDDENECVAEENKTTITFINLLDNSDGNYYSKINAKALKNDLVRHYLALFCKIKNNFPKIIIQVIIDKKPKTSETILASDVPSPDKTHPMAINYSKIENNKIIISDKKEYFELKAFRIESEKLEKNEIKLISKDEIARELYFDGLLPKENIDGYKFLFLLSSEYIDKKDTDTRGQIKLLDGEEFLNQFHGHLNSADGSSFHWSGGENDEEILLSDIENKTNIEILKLYPEIDAMRKEKNNKIDELREMFLLNQNAIAKSKITINDNYEDILAKVYREEARLFAQKDAKFREHFRKIQRLTPNEKDYQSKLGSAVNEFVRDIPLKDKTSLSRYIAHRRLVLAVFDDLLYNEDRKKQLDGRVDEGILHNLIFQQHTKKPEYSDLWLINEDFIYFEGASESYLRDLSYRGEKIFKDDNDLTDEENEYRLKQGGDANLKRTDILLFPKEGKCIIVELKAPTVNVSEHLNQITRYASLIHNLSKAQFGFNTYYGYLLGENIDIDDIRDNDSDFKPAYHLDYLFRPYKEVVGKFGRSPGSLYTEILKYSTLLDRANMRNSIFFEKLGINNTSNC
jgi:hypothetical protein